MLLKHLSVVALCVVSMGEVAFGRSQAEYAAKFAPNVATARGSQDVLVYLKDQAALEGVTALKAKNDKGRFVYSALTAKAQQAQRGVLSLLTAESLSYQSFYIANAIAIHHASRALLETLAARPDVARIVADRPVRVIQPLTADQKQPDAILGVGDNIHRTGADRVWSELHATGSGIVIAGNDTGIDWTHPALKTHYRGFGLSPSHDYNWHDSVHQPLTEAANPCGYDTVAPCDDHGHGTHTIGTTLGDDGAGNQIGMAPGAQWIGCRNMDAGVGKPSTYLECFEFFLAPYPHGGNAQTDGDPTKAPHVINNSWGCPTDEGCDGTEFLTVLNALKAAGIMVVAAAGNDGSVCSSIKDSPAHHTDEVFVVGAFDHRSDTIASFSSRGPSAFDQKLSPDLSAPGVTVRSSIPGGTFASAGWSGTSMASPHVTGAVALLWSARPELIGQIDATIAVFRGTATPKTSTQTCGGVAGSNVPNNTFGNGLLDVYAAATRQP